MVYYLDDTRIFKKYKLIGDKIRESCANLILKLPFSVSPNQVSLFAFLLAVISALSFAYSFPLIGALFYYLSDVFDGADGIIARKKRKSSIYGAYLDSCLDRVADALIFIGICVYLSSTEAWIIGTIAMLANFMMSYSTHRAEALNKVVKPSLIPWYRRTRMHVILIATVLGQLFWGLVILAFMGILKFLWRLMPWMLADYKSLDKKTKKLVAKTSIRKFSKKKSKHAR